MKTKLVRAGGKLSINCAVGFASLLAAHTAWAWPDLAVVKAGPAEAAPGQVINYTLTYTNKGPVKSTLVVLKDFLPNHVSVVGGTLDGGSISGGTITWNLGTMNSRTGGSRSFQVRINTNAPVGGSITNRTEIAGKEAEESGKTANNSSKWITRIIGPPPPVDGFCRAILAKQPITLHGTMLIDSFNSLNPNLSTNGRYDPAKRGDGGNVASISDSVTVITDTGNTKVYGRFETSPTQLVRITGQASVGSRAWVDGGNRGIQPGWHMTNLSAVISDVTLPGLTFTSLPQNSGTVNGTNYTYVLNSGNYSRSSDLTLSSSQRMLINGNVVLYFQKKLTISGQAYIYIAPGAKLTVYLADTTSLSGGGTINGTGFATNCAYLGLPSCTSISFSGNSEYVGTVYAPQATVQMSGGGSQVVNFIGAAVAKAFDISGNYQFHFDEGLCRECLPPQIVVGPGSLTNCPGTIATFSVSATGTGLSYAWFKDNAALSGQTNSILTIPNVIAGNAGTYRVVVTGACGDMATNAATLTVGTPVNATELANVVQPAGGSATFATVASGSGPFTYVWSKDNTILPGQTGSSLTIANIARSDAGNYTVHVSGNCGSVTRSGMLTVANSVPVANNDAYSLAEDTELTLGVPGVLGNDSDPDNDSLTAIIVGQPLNGTVTLNANGGFVYRPASNYVGMDAFTYKANDGMLDSGIASVTLTITNLNDRPVALNDAYSLAEETVLTIAAAGVLGNDSDPDNDPLTAAIVGQPANGTVILNANGGFIYSPTTNYTGTDSFTYKANDGLLDSGIATVSITVTPLNDPPVAADDNYSTDEDTILTVASPGVLANDSDPDGDAFVVLVMSVPAHGSLTLNTNGGFVYTPTNNYSGNDTFTYRAFDGQTNSNIATATITITPLNDPPVAGNDSYTTPEDSVLNISSPGVLENDSDTDGDPLSVMLVNGPAHGAVTLNANGSFAYTPATDYTGPDSFTYKANDGSADSGVAKVNIAVTPLNDPPVAVNDRYSTDEDTTLMVPLPGILANDSDPDGDSFIAELVSGTAHGALTFGTNGGFNYTPTNNYSGTDSFAYRAFDGQTNSNVATVIITINPLGDRPIANRDSYTTPENTALIIAAPGILANDSDPDGDPLIAVLASNPAHGTLTLNADGSFTYVPINQYTGPDSYTYWASDGLTNSGQVGVVITVTPVNDPPVAVNDIYITIEDTALNILAPGVLINDSDLDGDALNAVLVTSPVNGTLALNANGGFVYIPATNYTGPDHFTYRANDGTLQSAVATASITVTPLNDPPVAVDDNYSTAEDAALNIAAPGVLTNDIDPDGDSLSALLVSNPAYGTLALNPNGSFVYTPTNNFNGLDTFTYRASDGPANSDIATVTIRVTPVNDPPDTNNWNGRSFTLYEDTPLEVRVPGLLAGIVDLDLDALQALFENHPLHGTLTLNTNGSFFHRPVTNYFGSDSFQFRIGDGQILSPILTVNLTVIPVNDAPSFSKGPNQFHQQDPGVQTLPGWAADVSPGPDNEASQSVTFQLSNDNNAMFSVQPAIIANGILTYTPAPNAWGVATVTVVARDDGGTANGGVDSSDPQTFSITVNSPPTVSIVSPTNGASFFVPGNFTLLADAHDADGTIEKVELFAGTNKIAEANSGAPYFAVLTNLPVGSYTYGATATDNHGATGAATPVTVNVIARPPVTFLTSVYYNPQTDFYEQRLRIHNPTYSLLDAVRICVYNLTNLPAITVHNRTGYTNGIPYVQTHAAVPPGSFVDMTVEFHSPMRIKPNPILQAELVPPATAGAVAPGTPQTINRVLMLANKTFMIEFSTLSNRLYSIQYSSNLIHWRAVQPAISGNGNWVQWIDNGQPKTDSPPASQPARYYRLMLLP